MHLLAAQQGALTDADEAIDLGQSPADVVFLTAADTEIAALSAVLGADEWPFSLRCASVTALSHNMSVDLYADQVLRHAKLIIVRCLGGANYWRYGLEACQQAAERHGVRFIALSGDDKPDPSLDEFGTEEPDVRNAMWAYFREGGPSNMSGALAAMSLLLADKFEDAPAARPFLNAGLYWPGVSAPTLADLRSFWSADAPVVAISFYRALVQAGGTGPVDALIQALRDEGLNALPIYVSSLKDPFSQDVVRNLCGSANAQLTVNLTGFAVGKAGGGGEIGTVLDEGGRPVIQAILASTDEERWRDSAQGLTARDLAMNIALPEVDGRLIGPAIAFKSAEAWNEQTETNIVCHVPVLDRCVAVAKLAAKTVSLNTKSTADKRVAIILANYPNRDGRLGNGVGLDTPAGTIEVLRAMAENDYPVAAIPEDGNALVEHLMAGPTNAATDGRDIREVISVSDYNDFFAGLPAQIQNQVVERWGQPTADPFFLAKYDAFTLPLCKFGETFVGIQPARGYNIDPKDTYHSPDLVPPHGYIAFYAYLQARADAVVHMGKHGNLEWLPGKALAPSTACWPEALLGPLPNIYPFIVNDPGEGTQAKRRNHAVIVDHLTPPLTRAETYGPLADLEALVDEYYQAVGTDPRRVSLLKRDIMQTVEAVGLDADASINGTDSDDEKLEKLDAYLCDLKEMQIRDGLHIFGVAPEGRLARDLVVALARLPRGTGEDGDASLHRAIADGLELDFDPLDCAMEQPWNGLRPDILSAVSDDMWRTNGDTVERIELLAAELVDGLLNASSSLPLGENKAAIEAVSGDGAVAQVLAQIRNEIAPSVAACGAAEIAGILAGLEGVHVPPGSSGAPTRGRLDVLPTGRNFYSVDSRAVPTPTAWELGRKSAELVIARHVQDHGDWPISFGLSAWGTSNMRTGGDDIAQALAFIGAKPVWDGASRRVTGYEITPLAALKRPRVDVTLRISGFFRDAFPAQIALFDQAVRAIAALDEPEDQNPIAARFAKEKAEKLASGMAAAQADAEAGYRVFGSKPGAYGAGLQALIDEKGWDDTADLAESYMIWGGYAYGARTEGENARATFERRLAGVEAVLHNQDNREHDILDSDDYYQFEGGMTAAVEAASGMRPTVYHNDHSRPERPVVRRLEEEIGRVVRARAANPKWIAGVMRHGYKGAFEMAATVDYLFAFAATTGAVRDHHFAVLHDAYLGDEAVRVFLKENNPNALREMADRFDEAITRGLWTPRRNAVQLELDQIRAEVRKI
ncbi:MAG: cobaltochelatase subunit CobN [Pseudomonadota bacterium]